MSLIRKTVPVLVAACLMSMTAANAQGLQNWATNEANKILQDQSSGAINANQAANLQNRDAQIQAQQQQYLNQNGGTLTPQQSQQIGSELRHLNGKLNRDVRNNPTLAPGTYPPGYVPPAGYVPQNGYIPNNGYVPPGYNPAYNQQNPNGYPRRHHHHWNNGVAPNGQYWGH